MLLLLEALPLGRYDHAGREAATLELRGTGHRTLKVVSYIRVTMNGE